MMISKEEAQAETGDAHEEFRQVVRAQQLHNLPDFAMDKIETALGALQRGDVATAGAKLGELRQAIIERAEEIGYAE